MMKRLVLLFIGFLGAMSMSAQNEFGLYGALNMSTSSSSQSKSKFGGSIGALYNYRLTDTWWIQPRLVLGYQENESKHAAGLTPFFSQWVATVPVLMSFKAGLGSDCSLRVNAGPYLQYAAFGRDKRATPTGSTLGWWHLDFGDHFTYGAQLGLSVEYGHWMGLADFKHSLRKSVLNLNGFENTFTLGVGYKF